MKNTLNRQEGVGGIMAKPKIELYNWQIEAGDAIQESIDQGDDGAAVAAITGSGKTMVAIEEMKKWEYRHPTIWCRFTVVVPTKALAIQWRDELIEHGVAQPEEIGRIGGGSIKGWTEGIKHKVNITTIQSLQRGKGKLLQIHNDDFHYVIVDECHNLRGAKNRTALAGIRTDFVLGLSATPHPNDEARQIVEQVIGKIVYSYRYAQALADGVIPPFVLNCVRVKMDSEETKEVERLSRSIKRCMQDAEYNTREERNRLHAIARNLGTQRKRVINRVKSRFHMALRVMAHHGDVPTLLFHESTEDVDRLSQMTPHFDAAVYHSNHPSKDSELERFKNKETNHLYSCLALTEGFNVPFVQVAIMMSGPNAPLRRIQTLGRSLRGNTDEVNQVYFFYVNHKKDIEGLHNLIETADLPPEVIKHYEMTEDWMKELPPLPRREKWIPISPKNGDERPVCERCGRPFRGQVGLNNHHCVPPRAKGNSRQRLLDILDGKHDDITFDEFMEGF